MCVSLCVGVFIGCELGGDVADTNGLIIKPKRHNNVGLISALNITIPIALFSRNMIMWTVACLCKRHFLQSDVITQNTCVREHLMLSGLGEKGVGAQVVDASYVS